MSRRRALLDQPDLLLCGLLLIPAAVAASGTIQLPTIVRAGLTIPFALFLPGYVFINALFPALVIPAIERLVLSIGSSICLVILAGLVLGATGQLAAGPWALAILAVTVLGLVVAWARRIALGQRGPRLRNATMPRLAVLAVASAVLLTANVVAATRLIAVENEPLPPLQLWMVPDESLANSALLGVRGGPEGGDYQLDVSIGGQVVQTFDVEVGAGEVWQTILRLSPEQRAQSVEAQLYEGDRSAMLRFVILHPGTGGGA